jgi:hydroxypyruvate isomerase
VWKLYGGRLRFLSEYRKSNKIIPPIMNRQEALRAMAVGAISTVTLSNVSCAKANSSSSAEISTDLKGNINHSVSQWCYGKMPIEDLIQACKVIGIKSIELLHPDKWKTVVESGLTCAMAYANGVWLEHGFNDPKNHEQFLKDYSAAIPVLADAGLKNVICFSGNRRGLTDEQGWENCARGLEPILKIAQQHNVTVQMELLNSKVDHKDYQCDRTEWGVRLCEKLGSENFKLLYDIYHMQIMEGDVIATIKKYHQYIGHYHTAGVPGRNEIDDTQELYYPAIMRAIVETGFKGFVGQEFVPKREPLKSLEESIRVCDV